MQPDGKGRKRQQQSRFQKGGGWSVEGKVFGCFRNEDCVVKMKVEMYLIVRRRVFDSLIEEDEEIEVVKISLGRSQKMASMDGRKMEANLHERGVGLHIRNKEKRKMEKYVICSECHQGGDNGLVLHCELGDSPAHTYCVALGREESEGNWYCGGCTPVALGSSCPKFKNVLLVDICQSLPGRASPVAHVREIIELHLMCSPFSQGFGNLSSRFSSRCVEGTSPVSGGGPPTLSERRWTHHQIQQLLQNRRINSTTSRRNSILATNSISNFHSLQIDPSRERATQRSGMQDVGTSYHITHALRRDKATIFIHACRVGTLWQ
ncbi:uncharacterized protein LOC129305796 [Prosopis cineraria]|uniref:uncharacterized protein LOC129305796 n=1 Tax=Prosopis cineraria TaxID=364024 RepID=UPI00240FA9C8|nr:uncharacterized protein LOC129305796 [Prosopis cineraria]XP_054801869.1 uncharacterized protein LOC129305796 [Prosopis cineraria]